jgi:hypothetical protein
MADIGSLIVKVGADSSDVREAFLRAGTYAEGDRMTTARAAAVS